MIPLFMYEPLPGIQEGRTRDGNWLVFYAVCSVQECGPNKFFFMDIPAQDKNIPWWRPLWERRPQVNNNYHLMNNR